MLKESTPSILCFYFRFFKPVLDGQVSIIIVSFSNVLFAQNFWTSYQLKVYFFFLRFLISEILSTFKYFLLQSLFILRSFVSLSRIGHRWGLNFRGSKHKQVRKLCENYAYP